MKIKIWNTKILTYLKKKIIIIYFVNDNDKLIY